MTTIVFRIAGLTNIVGVLVFSLGLTNERLIALSPVVFSRFGLISIMLWGAAYIAVAARHNAVPLLVAVFAIEKFIYVATWGLWLRQHAGEMRSLFAESPLTATFYAVYGPIDLAFGVFFSLVALRGLRAGPAAP